MNARASVIFKGRVQGVFFRANTRDAAGRFGVLGWVRNLNDGSVEAIFEGDRKVIENVIEWCKTKQPHAHVESVEVKWLEYQDEFKSFEIRY
jgi:acylphosphatase